MSIHFYDLNFIYYYSKIFSNLFIKNPFISIYLYKINNKSDFIK